VNGRRGILQRRNASSSSEESDAENTGHQRPNIANLHPRPGVSAIAQNLGRQQSPQSNRMRNRERQLETLRRLEEKFKSKYSIAKQTAAEPAKPRNTMAMYVLDIYEVLSHKRATWLPPRTPPATPDAAAPEITVLYSLVLGMSELIMFGGIEKDEQEINNYENTACSHLRIISAPRDII
jgi:hypothetical protein